jgi:peptidyl-prolyl cis-trans isomerase SurA
MIRKSNNLRILPVIAVLILAVSAAAWEILDGVAAVVDDKIILISELESQIQLAALQQAINLSDSAAVDSIRRVFLNQMIDDKLVLIEASKDTSIKVTNKQVEEALDEQITRIKAQFPSEDAFLKQLTAEGLTLKTLRTRYREQIKNQILKESLLEKKLGMVSVSSGEVKEFYSNFRDSLPNKPAGVRLAQILLAPSPSKGVEDSLKELAERIDLRAKAGDDFAILAQTYSTDASGKNGGDLGWFQRGQMVPEFEKAAYALQPGDVSDVVKTRYGFHIIKCLQKKGEKIRASHILISYTPSESDFSETFKLADSLYNLLKNGADFAALARQYSHDDDSRDKGGDLGWFPQDQLFDEFRGPADSMEIGDISLPIKSDYGYHILKMLDKKGEEPLDFKANYGEIEQLAKRYKTQKELQTWLEQARKRYFIQVMI